MCHYVKLFRLSVSPVAHLYTGKKSVMIDLARHAGFDYRIGRLQDR